MQFGVECRVLILLARLLSSLIKDVLLVILITVRTVYRKEAGMSTVKRRVAAVLAIFAALHVVVAPAANAHPLSDHVHVRGYSCGGSSVDWVSYSGANSSGVVDGTFNEFNFSIYGVPAWPGNSYVFMTIKCLDGRWHDTSVNVSRSWGTTALYDIGWV